MGNVLVGGCAILLLEIFVLEIITIENDDKLIDAFALVGALMDSDIDIFSITKVLYEKDSIFFSITFSRVCAFNQLFTSCDAYLKTKIEGKYRLYYGTLG